MSAPAHTARALNGWPTRRFELMRTPISELNISLHEGAYSLTLARVERDLARRGLTWMPQVYFSTSWHCPDRTPLVGVPFSLATPDLRRIEREVTAGLENQQQMARLLRHEVGHAYNYALRLHATREWREVFGPFSRPYRERFPVKPRSRQFVRHLPGNYAQKHPDEDFAETFAVWLTPRARWKRDHAGWGALKKLEYVDRVMAAARGYQHELIEGPKLQPQEDLDLTVARFYQRQGFAMNDFGFQDEAHAYLDEDLRAALAGPRYGGASAAAPLLRKLKQSITSRVVELLHVRPPVAEQLFDKYVARAQELGIRVGKKAEKQLLVSLTAIMTSHLLSRRHTGRFTHPGQVVGRRR